MEQKKLNNDLIRRQHTLAAEEWDCIFHYVLFCGIVSTSTKHVLKSKKILQFTAMHNCLGDWLKHSICTRIYVYNIMLEYYSKGEKNKQTETKNSYWEWTSISCEE